MNREVGVIGCKIYYPNTSIIQSDGCDLLPAGYTFPRGSLETDRGKFSKTVEVDYVPGTAMAIKRSVAKEIGLLDPTYSAYYEDVDLCFRVRNAGYKIIVAEKAIIYHFGSVSFGENSLKQSYFLERNRIRFVTRYFFGTKLFKILTLYDFKYTLIKIRLWSAGELDMQRKTNLKDYSNDKCPKSNRLETFKAITNRFIGKMLAFLSILVLK